MGLCTGGDIKIAPLNLFVTSPYSLERCANIKNVSKKVTVNPDTHQLLNQGNGNMKYIDDNDQMDT